MHFDEPFIEKDNIIFREPFFDFLSKSFFVSSESSGYACSIAAEMDERNIKKKDFYDFYVSTNIYKRLKECRNYTWETFRTNLLKNKVTLDKLILRSQFCSQTLSEEETIQESIELFARELSLASVNFINYFAGYNDRKKQFLYGNMFAFMFEIKNPVNYIQKECCGIARRGEKIFKKISRLHYFAED
jgi:hypothetical protein